MRGKGRPPLGPMVPEELPGSLSSGQRAGAAELARQHAREQVSSCGCREVVRWGQSPETPTQCWRDKGFDQGD